MVGNEIEWNWEQNLFLKRYGIIVKYVKGNYLTRPKLTIMESHTDEILEKQSRALIISSFLDPPKLNIGDSYRGKTSPFSGVIFV